MQVLEDGHIYLLDHVDGCGSEKLIFIKRSGGAVTHDVEHHGTNTQEVLRAVIDRTKYLDAIIPAGENDNGLWHLRMALACYEGRALRRKRAKLNREAGVHEEMAHDDGDLPFDDLGWIGDDPKNRNGIELLPTGPDGHIVPPGQDGQYPDESEPPEARSALHAERMERTP